MTTVTTRGEAHPRNRGLRLARAATRVRVDLPLATLDGVLVAGGYLTVTLLRFDGDVSAVFWERLQVFLPVALMAHVAMNWTWGLYGQMWRHASVAEARRVVLAGMSTMAVMLLGAVLAPTALRMPISVMVLGAGLATALIAVPRFHARLFAFHRGDAGGGGLRVGVIGAGEAGAAIVREMGRDAGAGLRPVAIFDDDPRKQGLSVMGVPVVGGTDAIERVAATHDLHQVLLAIPTAPSDLVRRVADAADAADLTLRVLPSMRDLVHGGVSVRDVRDLHIEDLLGRAQVDVDLGEVRHMLAGRVVLVTGAGGSIGSEIVEQVAAFGPSRLVLVDREETLLHDVTTSVEHAVPLEPVLADIRDRHLLEAVFAEHRPEVVFHAAANKHVPLLEDHPCEAVATNVVGTANLAAVARAAGVKRFVFISTDKAVAPASIMGATKWLGEQIVLEAAPAGSNWCAVRFGNVLGSRGSVIPTFSRQIQAGGPITVTDPRMTRYFMSVGEAVRLVLQAAAYATPADEVFMLEMGEPVNILALAQRMIRLSGREVGTDIPVRIVGARPGEKLVEELHTPAERPQPTPHAKIVRLQPAVLSADVLHDAVNRLVRLALDRHPRHTARYLLALARGDSTPLSDADFIELRHDSNGDSGGYARPHTERRSTTWTHSST